MNACVPSALTPLYLGAAVLLLFAGLAALIVCTRPARKHAALAVMFCAAALPFAAASLEQGEQCASLGGGRALICVVLAFCTAAGGPAFTRGLRHAFGTDDEPRLLRRRHEHEKQEAARDADA